MINIKEADIIEDGFFDIKEDDEINHSPIDSAQQAKYEHAALLWEGLQQVEVNKLIDLLLGLDIPQVRGLGHRGEYDSSEVNVDIPLMIDEIIQRKKIPVIVGASRVGKSVATTRWIRQNQESRERVAAYEPITMDYFDAPEVVLDEFVPFDENILLLQQCLSKNMKIVIILGNLTKYDLLRSKLDKSRIEYELIKIGPSSDINLTEFVAHRLQLPVDNQIVAIIAQLSGGNAMTADIICGILIENSRKKTTDTVTDFWFRILHDSWRQISPDVKFWHEIRTKVSDEVRDLVPDPLIAYIPDIDY